MEDKIVEAASNPVNYTAVMGALAAGLAFGGAVGVIITNYVNHLVSRENDPSRNPHVSGKEHMDMRRLEYEGQEKLTAREMESREADHRHRMEILQHEQQSRMQMLEKLVQFRGDFKEYLDDLKIYSRRQVQIDPQLMKDRESYRQKLAEEFLDELKSSVDNGISDEDAVVNEEDLERIGRLVDMKYPIQGPMEPRMPEHLKKIVGLFDEFSIQPDESGE